MNQNIVAGSNLVFYVLLVALLSGITLVLWQRERLRKARVRARLRQPARKRLGR